MNCAVTKIAFDAMGLGAFPDAFPVGQALPTEFMVTRPACKLRQLDVYFMVATYVLVKYTLWSERVGKVVLASKGILHVM